MIHFNIRSLQKNLTSLNDFILTVKETPEIIAISETKLQDENIYNISIPVKINVGKQSVSYMAIDIWKDLPSSLKDLSVYVFPKYIKRYLLSEQKRN